MGILSLFIFLVLIPGTIGLACAKIISLKRSELWLAAIPMGFFIELALFELFAFPWAVIGFAFSSLCITFFCFLCLLSILCIIYLKKRVKIKCAKLSFSAWEWMYCLIAAFLIGWQILNIAFSDIGYWASDDATYGAMANDTLTYNRILRNDYYTGLSITLILHRALQTSIIFPAFLSFFSGLSVASIYHTVLGIYYIIITYLIYAFLGKTLFRSKENTFVFLIILSMLYIFGFYTIYSQTYRLLGPNTQGKAVLAVSFFPFLYTLMINKLPEEYDRRFGIILLLLSAAATSMTLFGTITMIGNVLFPVIASLVRRKRNWKNLYYILWGSILPVIYCGIYLYSRLMP